MSFLQNIYSDFLEGDTGNGAGLASHARAACTPGENQWGKMLPKINPDANNKY